MKFQKPKLKILEITIALSVCHLLGTQKAIAQIERETLYKKETLALESQVPPKQTPDTNPKSTHLEPKELNLVSSNLPPYLKTSNNSSTDTQAENHIITPKVKPQVIAQGLKIGETIKAQIPESLIAFAGEKAPIRALISDPNNKKLKNAILLGTATLEKNSKRILIEFNEIIPKNQNESYEIKSYALDQRGILGIEGKLVTNEKKYFAAEFLASLAAGFTDSSVSRTRNENGELVTDTSMDTKSKIALTQSLSRTADHFADKIKQNPEYAFLTGPIDIQILTTTLATRKD